MSWRATAWAKETRGHRSYSQKLVLMILADYHNTEADSAWPKQETLANDCEMPVRTLQRCLKGLEGDGFISIHQGNQHRPTQYLLLLAHTQEGESATSGASANLADAPSDDGSPPPPTAEADADSDPVNPSSETSASATGGAVHPPLETSASAISDTDSLYEPPKNRHGTANERGGSARSEESALPDMADATLVDPDTGEVIEEPAWLATLRSIDGYLADGSLDLGLLAWQAENDIPDEVLESTADAMKSKMRLKRPGIWTTGPGKEFVDLRHAFRNWGRSDARRHRSNGSGNSVIKEGVASSGTRRGSRW